MKLGTSNYFICLKLKEDKAFPNTLKKAVLEKLSFITMLQTSLNALIKMYYTGKHKLLN